MATGNAIQSAQAPGTGTGTVTSVTATDTSIVVTGTAAAPTVATGTLDVIAADHPPAAAWSNNSQQIHGLANGSAAQDAAAFGQIPTSAGSIGGLLAANNLSDVAARQTAINNLAGAVTNHDVLAGNGSNITLRALAAADIPGTLNATTLPAVTLTGELTTSNIKTVTGNYTVSASTDYFILVNAASVSLTVTLPDATTCTGQVFNVKRIDGTANIVTLATVSAQTYDGVTSSTLVQFASLTLVSDGANWQISGFDAQTQTLNVEGSAFIADLEVFSGANMNGSALTGASQVAINAGTASVAPLSLTAGTNLTAAAAGQVEFDGTSFYATAAASSRQVLDTEQIQILSGTRTFTNNTSAQAIFNATTNGALTVQGSTTYIFECLLAASGFSASSHSINFGLAGSATFTGIMYQAIMATTAGGNPSMINETSSAASAITNAGTGTILNGIIRGTMRINAGGTIIPQLTQVTASAAAVVAANSFFRCWPVGSNTITNVGDWS